MFLKGIYCLDPETGLYPTVRQNKFRALLAFIHGTSVENFQRQSHWLQLDTNSALVLREHFDRKQEAILDRESFARKFNKNEVQTSMSSIHLFNYSFTDIQCVSTGLIILLCYFCNGIMYIQRNCHVSFNINNFEHNYISSSACLCV